MSFSCKPPNKKHFTFEILNQNGYIPIDGCKIRGLFLYNIDFKLEAFLFRFIYPGN